MRSYWLALLAALLLGVCSYWEPAAAAEGLPKLVPLKATLESANPAGARTASFVRDVHGRTRIEAGQFVTISDPVAGEAFSLDLNSKTAHRFVIPRQGARRVAGVSPSHEVAPSALGTRVIEGCETTGLEYRVRLPVTMTEGKVRQIDQAVQVWSCKELALPLLVETSDPVNGWTRHRYFNIQKGISVAPELFKVPGDFTIVGDLSGSK